MTEPGSKDKEGVRGREAGMKTAIERQKGKPMSKGTEARTGVRGRKASRETEVEREKGKP